MIRIVLIAISFLSVTIFLIVMQPSAPRIEAMAEADAATPVTRSDTDFEALAGVSGAEHDIGQTQAIIAPVTEDPAPENPDRAAFMEPAMPSTPLPPQSDLERMIVEALKQGQSDAYIDALVNDAAGKGKVEVPGALLTADGRVDTTTLLKLLSSAPDALRAGGRIHTVQPGDSLASISFRFYGTTDRHQDIYEANRETMAATGQIAVGQELVIPAN